MYTGFSFFIYNKTEIPLIWQETNWSLVDYWFVMHDKYRYMPLY